MSEDETPKVSEGETPKVTCVACGREVTRLGVRMVTTHNGLKHWDCPGAYEGLQDEKPTPEAVDRLVQYEAERVYAFLNERVALLEPEDYRFILAGVLGGVWLDLLGMMEDPDERRFTVKFANSTTRSLAKATTVGGEKRKIVQLDEDAVAGGPPPVKQPNERPTRDQEEVARVRRLITRRRK